MKMNKRWPVEAPEPGIYPNTPSEVYHSWAAINASCLKEVAKSPLQAWCWMNQDAGIPSGAMHMGTILHCAVLEPEVLRKDGRIIDDKIEWPATGRERTLSPAAKGETWAVAKDIWGRLCHTQDMRDECEAWIETIQRDAEMKRILFQTPGLNEVAIVWEVKRFPGVKFKALIDRVAFDDGGVVDAIDVKTTVAEDEDAFVRQAWNLGYPEQMWHYRCAMHAASKFDERFPGWEESEKLRTSVLALYKGPPRDPALYTLPETELDLCKQRHTELLTLFLSSYVRNYWPGKGGGERRALLWAPWMHARYQDGGMT